MKNTIKYSLSSDLILYMQNGLKISKYSRPKFRSGKIFVFGACVSIFLARFAYNISNTIAPGRRSPGRQFSLSGQNTEEGGVPPCESAS